MNQSSCVPPAAADPASAARIPRLSAALAQAGFWTGPVALLFIEDDVEIGSTISHHLRAGFRKVVLCLPDDLVDCADLAGGDQAGVIAVRHDPRETGAIAAAVNALIEALPADTWVYYGFNAEYLFYPFCETRTLGEMLAFHAEERRDAMFACVVDLYPAGSGASTNRLDRSNAWIDGAGYYSLPRPGPDGQPLERQVEIHGGLRWRFDHHVEAERRRIDRIALFRTQRGLRFLPDRRFSVAEYNTFACPWHHNLTACVLSLRAAKALRSNPASRQDSFRFDWSQSVRCDWSSRQLMDLGLMEPGQWF